MILIEVVCFADDNEISASGENTKAPIGMGVLYGPSRKLATRPSFKRTFVGMTFGEVY